ncbi:MAG: S-layer homology domain-containing protein [Candidatus Margulisiibacteriota bacterium]
MKKLKSYASVPVCPCAGYIRNGLTGLLANGLTIMLTAIVICCLVFGIDAYADTGTTIDISRTIYSGRTLGMGGAHVALSDDGEGLFTNPSGLTKIQFPQMMGLSRTLFLDETSYSLFSWAMPTSWGTFGLGYSGAQTGGSSPTMRDPGTNRITINPSLEALSYNNSVTLLSYARALPWYDISVGGNLKFFNQSLNGAGQYDHAGATSVDLAASYKPLKYLNLGVNLQNILGGSMSWKNASEKLGGYYKLGAALNVLGADALFKHDQNVIACFDMDIPHDVLGGSTLMHIGTEWAPFSILSLRAGINQENAGTGLTFGVGFRNTAFRFDYAYVQRSGLTGDNPHYFSLSYIGDRTVASSKKFKRAEAGIVFLNPKNRSITSAETVVLKADVKAKKIFDQKTTWTVPLLEVTSEVKEVFDLVAISDIRQNGYTVSQTGTIEIPVNLNPGRNIISVSGNVTPENISVSDEVKVLRITPFSDVSMDYWAIEPITLNSVLGLIKGYPKGDFRPEKGITRAELTALLVRTGSIDSLRWNLAASQETFKDVKPKAWFAPYVNYGVELGLVTGYPNKTFKPNAVLNRAEGVTILARFAKLVEKEGVPFSDLKPGFWANKFIQPAKDAGILQYLKEGSFEASKAFSRAEAAEVLYRTAPIQKKVNEFWDTGIVTAGETTTTTQPTAEVITKPTTKEAH